MAPPIIIPTGPNSVIQVLLNIGHKASHRTIPHPNGFTHDWSAYVQGADGIDMHHFVEKVIFTLHETFTRPVQVVSEPPYTIQESGYASFGLKVDVVFKNTEVSNGENIMHYEYDLFLPGEGQPSVKYFRQEKLQFRDTSYDFRRRLLTGGAKETDPRALEEIAQKTAARSMGRQTSQTDRTRTPKSSDEEKKDKKKKDKEKSKHKKSKDKDKSSKNSSSKTSSSFLQGIPSRPREEKKPGQITPIQRMSNSDSSSSSSSSSDSPHNSPTNAVQDIKTTKSALSASDSSSDSDDDSQSSQISKPTHTNKRNSTPSHNNSSKKPRSSEKTKKSERNSGGSVKKAPNGVALDVLLDLHEKMKATEDADTLQNFVDLILDTNQYKMTETTFDFDLCVLDASVIHKLEAIFKR